jgi:hypothetical protein
VHTADRINNLKVKEDKDVSLQLQMLNKDTAYLNVLNVTYVSSVCCNILSSHLLTQSAELHES